MRTALLRTLFVYPAILLLPVLSSAQELGLEQEDTSLAAAAAEPAPADTVFYKIYLTEDGVTATDTADNDWYYDFEEDRFVMGIRPALDGVRDPIDPGYEGLDLPIEERASERRRVKPFEQRSLTIGYDEFVDGNVVAYGRVTVKGWVQGDIRSLTRVVITATGVVDGKVMAPDISVRPGAVVKGGVQETTAPFDISDLTEPFSDDFLQTIAILSAILLVITFLSTSLMPRQLNNIFLASRHYPIRSSLLGLLLLFLLPLVVTLVTVTIVGVLVLPFVPLLYVFALLVGVVAAGDRIGGYLLRRIGRPVTTSWLRGIVGVVIICLFWTVAAIFSGFDGALNVIGILIVIAVAIYTGFVMLSGLGAALLTRLGTRPYVSWRDRQSQAGEVPSPAPPPRPSAPPVNPPTRTGESSPDAETGKSPPKAKPSGEITRPPTSSPGESSETPPVSPPPGKGKRSDSDAT